MAPPAKKAKQLQAAQKYINKGQYDRAIRELQRIVDADPRDVRIWLKIGDLYAKRGAVPDAIATYLRVAEFYSEQGFHLKAIAVFRQILAIDPTRLEFNVKLAELYQHLGLTREAVDQLEVVVREHSKAGRGPETIDALSRMVAIDPDNIANRIRLAESYSRQGAKSEAAHEFSAAAKRLEESGRIDDFVKVAERLVYHAPDDGATLKRLAYIYIERRDPKRALAKLRACFKIEPNDAETLGLLAQAFRGIGQIPKTVQVLKELAAVLDGEGRTGDRDEVWRQILSLDPNDPDANRVLGRPVQQAPDRAPTQVPRPGNIPQAAPRPSNMPPSDSGTVEFDVPRGGEVIYEDDEVEELSAEDLEMEEIEEDDGLAAESRAASAPHGAADPGSATPGGPSSPEVTRLLQETDIYIKYGLQEKAIEHVQKVFAHDPDNIVALQKLSELHIGNGSYEEAAQVLLQMARALDAQGRYDAAMDALRRALDVKADDPELRKYVRSTQRVAELLGGSADDFEDEPTPVSLPLAPHVAAVPAPAATSIDAESVSLETGEFGTLAFDSGDDFESLGDLPIGEAAMDIGTISEAAVDIGAISEAAVDIGTISEAAVDIGTISEAAVDIGATSGAAVESGATSGAAMESGATSGAAMDLGTISEATKPLSEDAIAAFEDTTSPGPDRPTQETAPLAEAANSWEAPRPLEEAPQEEWVENAQVSTQLDTLQSSLAIGDAIAEASASARAELEPDAAAGRTGEGLVENDEVVTDALDEAEFFVVQGLLEDARAIVDEALERFPNDERLVAKHDELSELISASGDATAPASLPEAEMEESAGSTEPGDDTPAEAVGAEVDAHFATTLAEDIDATLDGFAPRASGATAIGVDDKVFQAFSHDSQQVEGDPETRFDLAIAYKEMGMIEAAVEEFQQVIQTGHRVAEGWQLIGLCHLDRGVTDLAAAAFKHGLSAPEATESEQTGLYYELGTTYESSGDTREALYYFEIVQSRDPGYRGVRSRITSLKAQDPGAASSPDSHASPLPAKAPSSDGSEEERMAASRASKDDKYYS